MTGYLDLTGPEGLRIRGTVLVVPGRGETAATYRRFGSRLAADAYRVRVLAGPAVPATAATLHETGAALTAALEGLTEELVRPLVLVGSDASAASVAALVAGGSAESVWWPDAVVLAGLPGYGSHDLGSDWDSELEARTHCPAHRGVLSTDPALRRGVLGAALDDALLDLAYGSLAGVPQLLLVGEADPIADRDSLARAAKSLPAARLSMVSAAHHDVLNDLQHRSVAAEVVSFLEVVRNGAPLRPIVTQESSAW